MMIPLVRWRCQGALVLLAGCCGVEHGENPAPFVPVDAPPDVPELAAAREGSRLERIAGAGGVSIPVRIFGEAGHLTPVVMTHGLQSHSGWFVQSARHLAALGHPVYAFDRRGSGLSEAPRGDCRDYREMLDDLGAVVDLAAQRHQSGGVHLLGHCFGAIPAAAFACVHPERLRSLILATPGIHTRTDLGLGEKCRVLWSQLTGCEVAIDVPLEIAMFTDVERYAEFIRTDGLTLRAATASFYYQVPKARRFVLEHLDGLTIPVFMATAGEDGICDNERNRELLHRMPSPRKLLVDYPEARHILEFSRERERFFADLASWLALVEGAGGARREAGS
jgi:alpha-beta hydrolase superfamily lysophospholipase